MKSLLSCILLCCLFSVSFSATTQKWLDILQQLENDWRTEDEIRVAMKDLWYNANEYLWESSNSNIKVIIADTTSADNTTKNWADIIEQLKKDWRTDKEIEESIEDLLLNTNLYSTNKNLTSPSPITSTSSWSKYISRSCKPYNIEYVPSLIAYTSPDLNKKEYFVSIDYLKRYVDSKNAQNAECYVNRSWITTPYSDTSNWTDRYIAPNWKIYFITTNQNWLYTSNELDSTKGFSTIDELKNYIKKRNPLISMLIYSQTTVTPREFWNTSLKNSSSSNVTSTDTNKDNKKDEDVISDLRKELFE